VAQIVNNNPLRLILTQYGLSRVAEAVANPEVNLNLFKIRLGSGDNFEYYVPSESQTSLKGDLGIEFYLYRKELLEDGLTVAFNTLIPENVGGVDIREVGLYETVGNEDHLFAISTQQPFVKPSSTYNYFMSIDYYMFIKTTNFAEVYDQIVLDSEHALVTDVDMEDFMRTFLFTHGNLINQIGHNSDIIGYDRPTQLYEIIKANKNSFGYMTLYKNYLTLRNMVNASNIFSYWVFDYSRRKSIWNSIIDLSDNSFYLSTNKMAREYERTYDGFMSMFSFNTPNYYFLNSDTPINLFDPEAGSDLSFSIIFTLDPLSFGETRTLMAKSNYATGSHTFEINELANRSIQIKLFTNASNYLTFTSDNNIVPEGFHTLVLVYNSTLQEFTAFVNSKQVNFEKEETGTYTHMNEVPGTLYAFSCDPKYLAYSDSSSNPTQVFNADGTPYTDSHWAITANVLTYDGNIASYSASDNKNTSQLYAWSYNDGVYDHVIYTKEDTIQITTVLYNADYTIYTGDNFIIVPSGDNFIIQYDYNNTAYAPDLNIPAKTLYAWKYVAPLTTIWANKKEQPTLLYTAEEELYTGGDWAISEGNVYFMGQLAPYNELEDKQTHAPNLTSYIINSSGIASQYVNSKVGIISIIKEALTLENARALSLLLYATMGKNPYLSVN